MKQWLGRGVFATTVVVAALGTIVAAAGGRGHDGRDRQDQYDHRDSDRHDGRDEGRFSFALWGDMPYVLDVEPQRIERLIRDINRSDVAFTVFDGDIKSGSSECTDSVFFDAIARFNTFDRPMVYVPGDNEWTDCHRLNNGSYDNLERLAFLRQTMFATPFSFGQHPMWLQHEGTPGHPWVENTRWKHEGVYFLGLNIPGSNNNKVNSDDDCTKKSSRTLQDCSDDNAEYAARDAANLAFLHDTFHRAHRSQARGVVIVIQADPGFDLPETEDVNERDNPALDGYTDFLDALVAETQAFRGQVMLVHGDTHFFKLDKPLIDQADLIPNFTRLQTLQLNAGQAGGGRVVPPPAARLTAPSLG